MDVTTKVSATDLKVSATVNAPQAPVAALEKQKPQEPVFSPAKNEVKLDAQKFERIVENVNAQLAENGHGIMFTVDEESNASVLKLVDKNTEEVIKQYPSEDSLRIMKNIQRFLDSVNDRAGFAKEGLTGSLLNEII